MNTPPRGMSNGPAGTTLVASGRRRAGRSPGGRARWGRSGRGAEGPVGRWGRWGRRGRWRWWWRTTRGEPPCWRRSWRGPATPPTTTNSALGSAALARRLRPAVILLDLGLPYRSRGRAVGGPQGRPGHRRGPRAGRLRPGRRPAPGPAGPGRRRRRQALHPAALLLAAVTARSPCPRRGDSLPRRRRPGVPPPGRHRQRCRPAAGGRSASRSHQASSPSTGKVRPPAGSPPPTRYGAAPIAGCRVATVGRVAHPVTRRGPGRPACDRCSQPIPVCQDGAGGVPFRFHRLPSP